MPYGETPLQPKGTIMLKKILYGLGWLAGFTVATSIPYAPRKKK